MKKIIAVTFATLALSSAAMALTIDGSDAKALRTSLKQAGAEVDIMHEVSLLSIKSLTCLQEGGFVLLPFKCEFVDNSSGRLEEVTGAKAVAIVTALKNSGVKPTSFRSGEHTKVTYAVKKITCTTSAMHKVSSCEITK